MCLGSCPLTPEVPFSPANQISSPYGLYNLPGIRRYILFLIPYGGRSTAPSRRIMQLVDTEYGER